MNTPRNSTSSAKTTMRTSAAWLLASAVLALSGCETFCPRPVNLEYAPPAELMQPAPTQYLLPEPLQRKTK